MKNIKFIVLAVLASLGLNIVAQTTKTYTFDDGVALETDWAVVLTGDGLTCKIANNIGGSLSTKEGNYLGFAFTKSNTTITITTKAEYTNISSIGIDLSANDNSKPSYSGYIVDGNGNVLETLFENIDSKNSFATGGAKKWGHKDIAVSSKTGYFRLSATTGSSGKYVAIDNITITYTAGSTTPDDPTPGDNPGDNPGDDPTPSTGETYAFWRFSGTDAPANGSSESGTKMTVEFINGKEGDTKTFGVESAAYNAAVTDENMMSQGTKGIKSGSNNTYMKVTVDGGFKANDVVSICGYNAWKISSSTAHTGDVAASVTTGTSKTDYNVGSFTLTADYDALYLLRAEGTGTCICAIKVERAGGTTPVTPEPVAVEDVQFDKTELTLTQGESATLTATVTPSDAEYEISWRSDNTDVATVTFDGLIGTVTALQPGTAHIMMSATQGSTSYTATCDLTVNEPAVQIPVTGIELNKTKTSLYIGDNETLTVTYLPADANTGKGVTWLSSKEDIATVANGVVTAKAVGTTDITATTIDGKYTASCNVTVEAKPVVHVTGVTLSPTYATVKVGKTVTLTATIEPGNADNKNLTWSSDKTNIATVVNGVVTGKAAGTAKITVKTEDGGYDATCNVTVEQDDTPTPPVPQTDLTIHKPEIYETPKSEGGYGGDLTIVSQREYEVYYMTRDADSKFCIATTNADKTVGITTRSSDYACTANDGWFQFSGKGWSSSSDAVGAEFGTMARRLDMDKNGVFEMHFSGYDQFAIVAKDKKRDDSSGQTKPENNRYLEVYIDEVLQDQQFNNSTPTIRRYDLTTGEHVVRIIHIGNDNSSIYGFSLRVAQEPIVRYIDGNDSSQMVKAGRELEPIYYYTKYNKFGETRLIWDGEEGTGVGLSIYNSDAVGDSIVLSGTPVCPAGEYNYRVESYTVDGVITRSISGKFSVIYEISFNNEEDTIAEAYQGEEMDYPIVFNYYAQSADNISLEWDGEAPEGITGTGSNGRYTITGTPTTLGTYNYTISVEGGNSLKGQLSVIELNLGEHPILYLQNKRYAYKDDGIYSYLKEQRGYNLVQRVTKDGLRPATQYEQYDWILISEDVNADNGEVMAIARGEAYRPVLNMKSFSYAPNRLDWGKPDNGSITDEGRFITVTRGDHPIFKNWKHNGDKIQILNQINRKGLMPVEVHYDGTLCLATALTRDTNYYQDGDPATFLHEIPASMHDGYKYICMPIALNSSFELAQEGKQLLEKVITYLQNDEPTVEPTNLEIKSFLIDTIAGVIDNINNTITFEINRSLFPGDIEEYLSAVVPTVTLADPENSYLIPDPNEPIDMNWTKWIPLTITVTDHVSQRVYTITINLWSLEGIEEVYTAGDWVNVFDIYGRKIATTNEDIYSMALPHGMYIVVTENGQTLKIMR